MSPKTAGIIHPGSVGVAIADINKDVWKDILFTNDFYGSDLLYINNKNERLQKELKNTLSILLKMQWAMT